MPGGNPANDREVGSRWSLRSHPTQPLYDFMIPDHVPRGCQQEQSRTVPFLSRIICWGRHQLPYSPVLYTAAQGQGVDLPGPTHIISEKASSLLTLPPFSFTYPKAVYALLWQKLHINIQAGGTDTNRGFPLVSFSSLWSFNFTGFCFWFALQEVPNELGFVLVTAMSVPRQ